MVRVCTYNSATEGMIRQCLLRHRGSEDGDRGDGAVVVQSADRTSRENGPADGVQDPACSSQVTDYGFMLRARGVIFLNLL